MKDKSIVFRRAIKWDQITIYFLIVVGAFIVIAPFLWVLSSSLRPFKEAISLPPKWLPPSFRELNFSYYKRLFEISIPFSTFMKNSLNMSLVIMIGMVVHGAFAGYAYARFRFPGKNVMFTLILMSMMVPVQATIVPIYKIMSSLKIVDTHLAVTLPSIMGAMCPGLAGAFGIFMMRQFFKSIPRDLEEAAAIDGAGPIRAFFSIMLPQAKASLSSLAIIVFSFSWNDYFTSFVMINSTKKMPVPVGILAIRQPFSTGDQFELAAVVLSILPVLMIFIFGQKWIMKSMVQTGIKG